MGGELDLLVPPLRGPILAGDQAHPMDATEVPVDEGVPGLGVVAGSVCQPEVPFGIVVPRMRLQEGVLVLGARLNVAPCALEHVLVSLDEPSGMCYGAFVHRVRRHGVILSQERR